MVTIGQDFIREEVTFSMALVHLTSKILEDWLRFLMGTVGPSAVNNVNLNSLATLYGFFIESGSVI